LILIGMSGFARSGKDAAAEFLVNHRGFKRIAFADKLRDFLYALNPIITAEWTLNTKTGEKSPTYVIHLQTIIDEYGWDHYKETKFGTEIRRLLQRLGTEAGRQTLWDTIWIDAALTDLNPDGRYVVSDARFLNEFDAITDRGGHILRVERRGIVAANGHASELEALQYDFNNVIHNDGTLEDYYEKLDEFLHEIGAL